MIVAAAGSAATKALIAGPARPGTLLAAFATSAYLRLADGAVIAVLTQDAVRLPCGLVLATTSTEMPLHQVNGPVLVGEGLVRVGALTVRLTRLVDVDVPTGLAPDADRVVEAGSGLGALGFAEHDPALLQALRGAMSAPEAAHLVSSLVGAGSGLTPSGDDVLAGFLVGAHAFGVSAKHLRAAVLAGPPGRTTDLSFALLAHAARGEAIPQVTGFVRALSSARSDDGRALRALAAVGHSSGAALATGVHAAAHWRWATGPCCSRSVSRGWS